MCERNTYHVREQARYIITPVSQQQYHGGIAMACRSFSSVWCGKVVAKGHVWECTTVEGENPDDATVLSETTSYEARVKGSLSLLVELDQVWCSL